VLREIASWLTHSFERKVILNGLIYLHRIIDIRMQGSAKKNLFMFKKLCGPDALKNVILATTMWEQVGPEDGERREKELMRTSEFWGEMIHRGAQVHRHMNTADSAWRLVDIYASKYSTKRKMVLTIQQEMVMQEKTLDETDAGREVESTLIQQREKWSRELAETREMMQEALEAKDKESLEHLRETEAKMNKKIEEVERAREELKVGMEKMHEDHIFNMQKRIDLNNMATVKRLQQMEKALKKGNQFSEETSQQPQQQPRAETTTHLVTEQLETWQREEIEGRGARMLRKDKWYSTTTPHITGKVVLSMSGKNFFFCGPTHHYWYLLRPMMHILLSVA
jgi:hypothetical protein